MVGGSGAGLMGFKSRCPLALLCRGHQHIPVLLRRRSSLPLRQPRLANRRSAAGSPERPLAVSAVAAAGRPARTVGCADATSDPARLWAPRRALCSAILRRAAWDNAAMVRRDRLRRWVLLAVPRGGCGWPDSVWVPLAPRSCPWQNPYQKVAVLPRLKGGRSARTRDRPCW